MIAPATTRRALNSHSWLGLLAGALLYLVCLSGTLAVIYPTFDRWEQPQVSEVATLSPGAVEAAYRQYLQQHHPTAGHLYLLLPRQDFPRASIGDGQQDYYFNQHGQLTAPVVHPWRDLLAKLHLYLLLPESYGMLVVSLTGIVLCALVISGLMAHRRIVKDAFSYRQKQRQSDLHNRLSVWGAPFHLMFGATGAYFGLAALLLALLAQVYYQGDQSKVMAAAFGAEPELQAPWQPAAIATALTDLARRSPDTPAIYVTLEDAGSAQQYLLIGARHRDRLIYAEQYRYTSAGQFIDKVGFADGAAGRQLLFSIYRLHFGHFGGPAVRVIYLLLGLALTVVCATGINIWLNKRRHRDALNNLWVGVVWGAPLALSLSAVSALLTQHAPALLWLLLLVLAMAFAQWRNAPALARRQLLWANSVAALAVVASHVSQWGLALTAPILAINSSLLAAALLFAWLARR